MRFNPVRFNLKLRLGRLPPNRTPSQRTHPFFEKRRAHCGNVRPPGDLQNVLQSKGLGYCVVVGSVSDRGDGLWEPDLC